MTATLDDLAALRAVIADRFGDDQRDRLLEHLDTVIRVREAQKTRSRTAWHAERQAAFEAALQVWQDQCERVAIGYRTEIAEFKRDHPMPRLTDFYRSDRPANACPLCGAPINEETS